MNQSKQLSLFSLILLISFPSVSVVLLTPALPQISAFFKVSNSYTQQLMTTAIVGYAIGQLVYSPVANRFGRKMAIYIGMTLYLVSCLICLMGIFIHQLDFILFGRFFMLLGAAVGMIISFTMINDVYTAEEARTITGYTVLAYALMPAIAIVVGGLITTHISWQGCFYFQLLYGILILAVCLPLPETLQPDNRSSLKIPKLMRDYLKAITTGRLLSFSLIYGLVGAYVYVVATAAPFIGINDIGLSPAIYGLLILIPYCGQVVGCLFAARATKRLSGYTVIGLGYISMVFGTLFMFISFACHFVNVVTLILPIYFIMMGLPMIYSNVTVMALKNYPDKATGSAIMSFITMFVSLLASLVLTVLPEKDPLVMPAMFLAVAVATGISYWYVHHKFREA